MEVTIKIPDNCELVKDGNTYIVIEKKIGRPKSWEEFCSNYSIESDECYIDKHSVISRATFDKSPRDILRNKNVMCSKQEADAFLALMQLRRLRKAWVGDWTLGEKAFAIIAYRYKSDTIVIQTAAWSYNYALSFPTQEMAAEFLDCFKDLCETAKILL